MAENAGRRAQRLLRELGFNNPIGLRALVGQPVGYLIAMGFSRHEASALSKVRIDNFGLIVHGRDELCYRFVIANGGNQYYGALTWEEAVCIATFLAEHVFIENSPYLDRHGQIEKWGTLSHEYNQKYPQFARNGFALNDVFNQVFYHAEFYEALVEAILEDGETCVYERIVMRYRNGSARARQLAERLAPRGDDDIHYQRALTAANTPANNLRARVVAPVTDDAPDVEAALFPPAPVVAAVAMIPIVVDTVLPAVEEQEDVSHIIFPEMTQVMEDVATPQVTQIPTTPFLAPTMPMENELFVDVSLPAFDVPPTQVVQEEEEEEEPREDSPSPAPTKPGCKCPKCGVTADMKRWHEQYHNKKYSCFNCDFSAKSLTREFEKVDIPMV